ncbi:metal ABC transporter permease [Micrococcales bacterium 31B]|nr:metal ABC transporter permease [Micrococcales bacterium 31B]
MADAWWTTFISFEGFTELVPLVVMSLVAGAIVGVLAGVVGPVIQARDLAFAVHGSAELSFAGAAGGLLLGWPVTQGSIAGSLIAALIFAGLGLRARDRNSAIGVVMAFGLGLGVLFLALYDGRSANKFGLLVGQIVGVGQDDIVTLAVVAVIVIAALAALWRPLMFASLDPDVAAARGVPTRLLGPLFMVLLGLTVAMTVQVIGALLVLSLLITPTAAAMRVTATPWLVTALSVVFAVVSCVGGILLSLSPGLPISPYVTTLSFVIYLVCRAIGEVRMRRGWTTRVVA